MKAIADHGARFVGCNVMFLEGGTRDHFLRWLPEHYPHLASGYAHLYARKYVPSAYRAEVQRVFTALRDEYGLKKREADHGAGGSPEARHAEQQMLSWAEEGG